MKTELRNFKREKQKQITELAAKTFEKEHSSVESEKDNENKFWICKHIEFRKKFKKN